MKRIVRVFNFGKFFLDDFRRMARLNNGKEIANGNGPWRDGLSFQFSSQADFDGMMENLINFRENFDLHRE